MFRSFKYQLRPTKNQERILFSWLDTGREIYNAALQERKEAWQKNKISICYNDQRNQIPELRKIRIDIRDMPAAVIRGFLQRLDFAFSSFFRRVKQKKIPGFPRFKSKDRFNTISINDLGGSNPFVASNKRIKIPNIGKIKINCSRLPQGIPKTIDITYKLGKWYIVVACAEVPQKILAKTNKKIGIDLGINYVIATSDKEFVDNPRFYQKYEKSIAKLQHNLSRKTKGSCRYRRDKTILAKKHQKIKNIRREFQISVAKQIVFCYDSIYMEKLNVSGMIKSFCSKQISDVAWSELIHWLQCKAEEAGKEVVFVDPRNTSQNCSECGAKVPKKLKDRIHICECGYVEDRDINAAKNILRLGMSQRRGDSDIMEPIEARRSIT